MRAFVRMLVGMPSPVAKPNELVGVCTRESSAVIRTATRADVRAQNLPHRCSYSLVVDGTGERVLTQKRVAWKEYPQLGLEPWSFLAGASLSKKTTIRVPAAAGRIRRTTIQRPVA